MLIKNGFKTNRSCRQMVAAAAGFQTESEREKEREREKNKRGAGGITTAEIIAVSELISVITRQRSEEADLLRFSPLNEKRFIVVMGAAALTDGTLHGDSN